MAKVPGQPWTAKNQGKKIMFGGVAITFADPLSGDGNYPNDAAPPYQKYKSRKLATNYAQLSAPTAKDDYYAGGAGSTNATVEDRRGYWYGEREAITWYGTVVYYKGRYALNMGEIFAASIKQVVLVTGQPAVKCMVLWRRVNQTDTGIAYFSFIPDPSGFNDKWAVTLERTVAVPDINALHNNFSNPRMDANFNANADRIGARFISVFFDPYGGKVYSLALNSANTVCTLTLAKDLALQSPTYSRTLTTVTTKQAPSPQFAKNWGTDEVTSTSSGGSVGAGGLMAIGKLVGNTYHYIWSRKTNPTVDGSSHQVTSYLTGGTRPDVNQEHTITNTQTESVTTEVWLGSIDFGTLADTPFGTLVDSFSQTYTSNFLQTFTSPPDSVSLSSASVDAVAFLTVFAFHPEKNFVYYLLAKSTGTSTEEGDGTTRTATLTTVSDRQVKYFADGVLTTLASAQTTDFVSSGPGEDTTPYRSNVSGTDSSSSSSGDVPLSVGNGNSLGSAKVWVENGKALFLPTRILTASDTADTYLIKVDLSASPVTVDSSTHYVYPDDPLAVAYLNLPLGVTT